MTRMSNETKRNETKRSLLLRTKTAESADPTAAPTRQIPVIWYVTQKTTVGSCEAQGVKKGGETPIFDNFLFFIGNVLIG
jgi:hypothetical protein